MICTRIPRTQGTSPSPLYLKHRVRIKQTKRGEMVDWLPWIGLFIGVGLWVMIVMIFDLLKQAYRTNHLLERIWEKLPRALDD